MHTTERLYKQLIESALLKAQKIYEAKDWQGAIKILNLAIHVARFSLDLRDLMQLEHLIAQI